MAESNSIPTLDLVSDWTAVRQCPDVLSRWVVTAAYQSHVQRKTQVHGTSLATLATAI